MDGARHGPAIAPSVTAVPSALLGPAPVAGRYLLLDLVATGGMGSVWRARDRRTGRVVAVKLLRHEGHEHDGLLRFVREQSLRVGHPHVLSPTGWAAHDDLVAFGMELCRGGSLQALLAEHGPLPSSYVAVLLDQLLAGLEAVHAAGVVHRDLKPGNLLLEPTGTGRPHLRLGDFGVAAPLDDVRLTRVPGPVGTEGYASPEQERGDPPDPRQDLYAVGAVGLALLTGSPTAEPPPDPLRPLLMALTRPTPDERPRDATTARTLLRQAGVPDGAPWQLEAGAPFVPDRYADRPTPRDPVVTAATGALGLSTATALAALGPLAAGAWAWAATLLVAGAVLAVVGVWILDP